MHPILLSPLVKWSLAALGGAMVVHWVVKEARRINEELDQRQAREGAYFRSGKPADFAAAIRRPANIGFRRFYERGRAAISRLSG